MVRAQAVWTTPLSTLTSGYAIDTKRGYLDCRCSRTSKRLCRQFVVGSLRYDARQTPDKITMAG